MEKQPSTGPCPAPVKPQHKDCRGSHTARWDFYFVLYPIRQILLFLSEVTLIWDKTANVGTNTVNLQ